MLLIITKHNEQSEPAGGGALLKGLAGFSLEPPSSLEASGGTTPSLPPLLTLPLFFLPLLSPPSPQMQSVQDLAPFCARFSATDGMGARTLFLL